MKVDLHIHSINSDGALTRKEILNLAEEDNAGVISITDHNFFKFDEDFKREAAKRDIQAVDGVEISAQYSRKEFHILGYNFKVVHPELKKYFARYAKNKTEQTKAWCNKSSKDPLILNSGKKLSVSFEELIRSEKDNGPYLWNEIVYVMVEKYNYIKEINEPEMSKTEAKSLLKGNLVTFNKFENSFRNLEKGKRLWYVRHPIEYKPAGEIIDLIQKSGGVSCLAHPKEQNLDREIIKELRLIGLDGIEIYSPKNRIKNIFNPGYYKIIAKEFGLLYGGGTDFHYSNPQSKLGMILEDKSILNPSEHNFQPIRLDEVTLLEKLLT